MERNPSMEQGLHEVVVYTRNELLAGLANKFSDQPTLATISMCWHTIKQKPNDKKESHIWGYVDPTTDSFTRREKYMS